MTILSGFEYIKTLIGKIRKNKIPTNLVLCINTKFYNEDELSAIMFYEGIIKKFCKLKNVIYYDCELKSYYSITNKVANI